MIGPGDIGPAVIIGKICLQVTIVKSAHVFIEKHNRVDRAQWGYQLV